MDPTAKFDSDRKASRARHLWGFSALGAAAVLLAAMSWNVFHAAAKRDEAERWRMHTMEVLLTVERTRSALNAALRGERGYLITQDERFLAPYSAGRRDSPILLDKLSRLTNDNPVQRADTARLKRDSATFLHLLGVTIEEARDGKLERAIATVKSGIGKREIDRLIAALDRIGAQERSLLGKRSADAIAAGHASDRAQYALAGIALFFLIFVGAAGYGASQARMQTLRREDELRRAATTDALTGLRNRRAFLEALDCEIARSTRSGSPLAVAIIDLDHFKSINDRFGHHGGDEVLCKFAETARDATRASDVVGRLGGEEFALLMPDTDSVQSGMAGERLRLAIAKRRFVLDSGALVPVTISVGVAHANRNETAERLMQRADTALYEAKDEGRNRTRMAA